jgi:uncharacterized protein (DUF2141 family)
MRNIILIVGLLWGVFLFSSFSLPEKGKYSLTIEADNLRNSKGIVQVALYNSPNSFPDENYKNYYRKLTAKIEDGFSFVTFENLPSGKYAVHILHDEDENGKIKKGLMLPKEGVGFSNYESIGIFNNPNYTDAGIILKSDTTIRVNVIYM